MLRLLRLGIAEKAEAAALVGGELDDPGDVGGGSVTVVDVGVCVTRGDVCDAVGVLGVAFGYDALATLAGGGRAGSSGSSGSGSSSSSAGDVHVRGHPDELDGLGEVGAGEGGGRGERGGALAVGPGGGRVIDGGVA